MEAIFSFIPRNGKPVWNNPFDMERYCLQNEGVDTTASFKASAKLSEKMKMYKFLFGPLMDSAVRGYARQGWDGIDKAKARYMLQAEFAKEEFYNSKTGQIVITIIDLSSMSKARLLKFLQDCIYYIETELETETPDSEGWKMKKITGKDYQTVK